MSWFLVCFLSGLLTALPMFVPSLAFVAWISAVPLYIALFRNKRSYIYGFFFGLGYFGALFYWFVYLYPLDFAGLDNGQSIAVIAVSWIGLALMQAAEIAFAPLIFSLSCKKKPTWYSPLILSSAWVLVEWLMSLGWVGVPWGRLAVTQSEYTAVIQSAGLFGSYFISFLIIAVNGYLSLWIMKIDGKKKPVSGIYPIIAIALALSNLIYGVLRIETISDSGTPVKAAILQGNIGSGDKWGENSLQNSLNTYLSFIYKASEEYDPDIIVIPETAVNTYVKEDKAIYSALSRAAKQSGAIIFCGAFESEGGENYNAIIPFYPDGSTGNSYYKRHLVPFGEYLPMAGLINAVIPALGEINMFSDSLSSGENSEITDTPFGKIGGLICFDSIYETLTLDSVRDGAELIVLCTNDSWYYDSPAVRQHQGHAMLRAVESGRWVVRAANTGISSLISPTGEATVSLGALEEGTVYGEVYVRDGKTLYSLTGNIIVPVCFFALLLTAVSRRKYNNKKNRRMHKM